MTKVVLNNDITKKELSMCTKLHYLENKYGKIAVYMYHSVIDKWIRVYNPYSFCGSEISDMVVYTDNTPDVIDMRYVNNHKSLYDNSILTLDKLRYDGAFIKVIEDGDHVYGNDNLRVEESTYPVASIRIGVDEETNREVAIFNPQWFTGELEYQFVEYNDAQDIDEVKNLLKDTQYKLANIGSSWKIYNDRACFNLYDDCCVIKTLYGGGIYVVDGRTFDLWRL